VASGAQLRFVADGGPTARKRQTRRSRRNDVVRDNDGDLAQKGPRLRTSEERETALTLKLIRETVRDLILGPGFQRRSDRSTPAFATGVEDV